MVVAWLAAALSSGVSCGLLGVYLLGFEMPFLGIAVAHAALAGAVLAHLCHGPVWLGAGGAAWSVALVLSRLARSPLRSDLGALSSILLSASMGIAFLGIGLAGERSPLLGLLWGNILFVRSDEAALLGIVTVGLLAFLATSGRMLDALVFARRSETYAFDPRYLLLAFMSLASFVITLNLQFVGGLLIYALLTNPAAAAYELGESMRSVRRLAVGFGLCSTVGGLVLSWIFDLPTGACVVLLSTVCYAFAYAVRMRRARSNVLQTAT